MSGFEVLAYVGGMILFGIIIIGVLRAFVPEIPKAPKVMPPLSEEDDAALRGMSHYYENQADNKLTYEEEMRLETRDREYHEKCEEFREEHGREPSFFEDLSF